MSFFTSGIIPPGVTLPYAGTNAPNGWLLCYGQAVSRTSYSGLFAAIGVTYGNGDGSTTFNLPDCRGRAVFGKDNMGGVAANRVTAGVSGITGTTLGAVGGSEAMHGHTHTVTGTTNIGHTHGSSTISGSADSGGAHIHTVAIGYTDNNMLYSDQRYMVRSGNVINSTVRSTNDGVAEGAHSHSLTGTAAGQTLGTTNVALSSGSAAIQGSGTSQNMVPTIIMNTIIKV